MKKILAFVLVSLLAFSLAIPATAQNITLPAASKADIVLDGVRDEGYGDMFEIKSYRDGVGDGATGKFWAAWNEKGIYYYVEVNDTTPFHEHSDTHQRDNVEFFIDWYSMANGESAFDVGMADDAWQVRIASAPNEDGVQHSGTVADGLGAEVMDGNYVVKPLSGGDLTGGYIIEVLLPVGLAEGSYTLAEGNKIFVDFQVADNQYDDGRTSQAFLDGMADGTDSQWDMADTFQGILPLGAAKAVAAPEPEVDNTAAGGGEAAPDQPVVAATPAPAPAPRTGDAGMVALIALLAVAAIAVVILRKKAVR